MVSEFESTRAHYRKRFFDVCMSILGIILFGWLIVICWIVAALETRSNGFFFQARVGQYGKIFRMIKIKTMYNPPNESRSTVTVAGSSQITRSGRIMRGLKLDELPQFWNVLIGEMSIVGPRPDVPGFADTLKGEDKIVLSLRPGITGPASLAFRDEERLLAGMENPEIYNRDVIWPEKVRLNKEYARNLSLARDVALIFKTLKL